MLEGAEGGVQPFWSPDSRFLAFSADGKLKKISVSGGLAQTLADAAANQSGTWSRDDVIVFRRGAGGLYRVVRGRRPRHAGDDARRIARRDRSLLASVPAGRQALSLSAPRAASPNTTGCVYVGSLDSTRARRRCSPPTPMPCTCRRAIFSSCDRTPSSPSRSTPTVSAPTGEPLPVAEQIEINTDTRRGAFSVVAAGVLAYRPGRRNAARRGSIGAADSCRRIGPPGHYRNPALSPDEQRVAVARIDAETGAPDIWLIELARGVMSRLTSHPALDDLPIWSRDGQSHRVQVLPRRAFELVSNAVDRRRNRRDGDHAPATASCRWTCRRRADIWSTVRTTAPRGFSSTCGGCRCAGDRKPIPVRRTMFNETQAQLSPDGRWIAYVSNDSGRNEINISRVSVRRRQMADLHQMAESSRRWRGDGKELFFVALDQSLMAVAGARWPQVQAGVPGRLFDSGMRGTLSTSYTGINTSTRATASVFSSITSRADGPRRRPSR